MLTDLNYEKTTRKTFARIGDFIEMPNLIEVQKDSYDWFVKEGLGEVLKDISPIVDYSRNLVLEFFDYYMEEKTKYSLEEAKERDATYSTRLHVKVRLINRETGMPVKIAERPLDCVADGTGKVLENIDKLVDVLSDDDSRY